MHLKQFMQEPVFYVLLNEIWSPNFSKNVKKQNAFSWKKFEIYNIYKKKQLVPTE